MAPTKVFNTIIFDCDSTLSAIEGIDELAVDQKAAISALTDRAMRGELRLEEVYGQRLEIVRPTRDRIDTLGRLYVQEIVEGAAEVCRKLHSAGKDIRVISGGLRPAVLHLSRHLNIPDSHVAAVDVYFDSAGNYAGFDTSSPLARSGGKLTLLRSWLPTLERPIMMVGDGSTDLEVKPIVDLFVAYAGVVARGNVIAQAGEVVRERSLLRVLELSGNC